MVQLTECTVGMLARRRESRHQWWQQWKTTRIVRTTSRSDERTKVPPTLSSQPLQTFRAMLLGLHCAVWKTGIVDDVNITEDFTLRRLPHSVGSGNFFSLQASQPVGLASCVSNHTHAGPL